MGEAGGGARELSMGSCAAGWQGVDMGRRVVGDGGEGEGEGGGEGEGEGEDGREGLSIKCRAASRAA